MQLLFSMVNHVHNFGVRGEIHLNDLGLLRAALLRFFDSQPLFVVLDLSQASLMIPESDIQKVLMEIQTIALSKDIRLSIAQTDLESIYSNQRLLESALEQKARALQHRIETRENMRSKINQLRTTNQQIKKQVETLTRRSSRGFLDRLWSSK